MRCFQRRTICERWISHSSDDHYSPPNNEAKIRSRIQFSLRAHPFRTWAKTRFFFDVNMVLEKMIIRSDECGGVIEGQLPFPFLFSLYLLFLPILPACIPRAQYNTPTLSISRLTERLPKGFIQKSFSSYRSFVSSACFSAWQQSQWQIAGWFIISTFLGNLYIYQPSGQASLFPLILSSLSWSINSGATTRGLT